VLCVLLRAYQIKRLCVWKGVGVGAERASRVPVGTAWHPPARRQSTIGIVFQSTIGFGMTRWSGIQPSAPLTSQPPRGWSPAAGSAEKAPSWEPIMLWKTALTS
jgi:hypothetical protein